MENKRFELKHAANTAENSQNAAICAKHVANIMESERFEVKQANAIEMVASSSKMLQIARKTDGPLVEVLVPRRRLQLAFAAQVL